MHAHTHTHTHVYTCLVPVQAGNVAAVEWLLKRGVGLQSLVELDDVTQVRVWVWLCVCVCVWLCVDRKSVV